MRKEGAVKKLWWLLLALAVLLALQPAFGENITEIRIDSITTPIKAGGRLDFSFSAGNRAGPECSAQIDYWFEEKNLAATQGSDNFYLGEGQTASESISLIMPTDIFGVKTFYLQMKCNESTILASRIIEVKAAFPELPQFGSLVVNETVDGKQLEFSYNIQSSSEEKVAINVKERIVQDQNIVWANTQNIAVKGSNEIKRFGPVLPPGNYRLVMEASYGSESARLVKEFSIKAAVPPLGGSAGLPAIAIAALVIVLLAAMAMGTKAFLAARNPYQPVVPAETPPAAPDEDSEVIPTEERIRLFEADSSGVPTDYEISGLVDRLGLKGEKRDSAIEFAGRTEVMQNVKTCIVIRKSKKAAFETLVSISLANYTNRNWLNLVIVARLPSFLGKEISEISEDTKASVKRRGPIARFTLEKVGAMQSVQFSYKVPKLISQSEANSVPLPGVIGYEEGEPLIITQVKVEKREEAVKQDKAAKKGLTAKSLVQEKKAGENEKKES